eukprot:TRINITY_DN60_c0_g1_i1.p1 TRINITY_DN60_c0_g1~~TRINITY_DN60_c0_g1_i1.p1  ORF type:complete len:266 (-),score=55.37 TRINITY_DN60_c0_g1_i1:89-886(-)
MDIKKNPKRKFRDEDEDNALSFSCPIPSRHLGFWKDPAPTQSNTTETESRNRPFLIGVCGGTASGKTTVCDIITQKLDDQRVATISLDSFYRNLTPEELTNVANHNFDHPDAFDWELLTSTLEALYRGKTVSIPTYDFTTHSRLPQVSHTIHGSISDIVIVEGILLFHPKEVVDLLDMKLFVDTDADTRLARRVRRDIADRGRSLESILKQYEKFVKPSFDEFILPTKKYADVIIPRGSSNTVAIDIMVQHIKQKILEKQTKRYY